MSVIPDHEMAELAENSLSESGAVVPGVLDQEHAHRLHLTPRIYKESMYCVSKK